MHNGIRAICTVNWRQSSLLWNAKASDGITTACCGRVSVLTLCLSFGEARLDPALTSHSNVTNVTVYSPVVTIHTAILTLTNSTFCPHSVFMCFVWLWEQTGIISLYSTDWLVFVSETECVYCAVRSTFYVLPTQCICVFCVDLRTNSDYLTVQH